MKDVKKVIIIGLDPDVVDYSKWPDLSAEKVRKGLEKDRDNLIDEGFQAELLYIDNFNTAFEKVAGALKNVAFDVVLIGAGVRKDPDNFLLFEQLVNAAHQSAPSAKICFNTNPTDTAEAVKRWINN